MVSGPLQDTEGAQRDPLAWLALLLEGERPDPLHVHAVARAPPEVRMHRVEVPPAVRPPLLLQEREGGAQPLVVGVSEPGDDAEPHQDVVVVVVGIVEPEPGEVSLWAFLGEPAVEEELCSPLRGALDASAPLLPGEGGERAQPLPAVERPPPEGLLVEAVPPAVLHLRLDELVERRPHVGMVLVPAPDEGPRQVARDAVLAPPEGVFGGGRRVKAAVFPVVLV